MSVQQHTGATSRRVALATLCGVLFLTFLDNTVVSVTLADIQTTLHAGVPAFSVNLGTEYYGKAAGYGAKAFEEYNDKHYHQPSDEYRDDWDFAGMEEADPS